MELIVYNYTAEVDSRRAGFIKLDVDLYDILDLRDFIDNVGEDNIIDEIGISDIVKGNEDEILEYFTVDKLISKIDGHALAEYAKNKIGDELIDYIDDSAIIKRARELKIDKI